MLNFCTLTPARPEWPARCTHCCSTHCSCRCCTHNWHALCGGSCSYLITTLITAAMTTATRQQQHGNSNNNHNNTRCTAIAICQAIKTTVLEPRFGHVCSNGLNWMNVINLTTATVKSAIQSPQQQQQQLATKPTVLVSLSLILTLSFSFLTRPSTAWVLNYQPCHNFQCAFAFEFVCCNWPATKLTTDDCSCSCIYC